jgi:hypothetical protein
MTNMKKKKRGEEEAIWKCGQIGYLVCPYCDKVLLFADRVKLYLADKEIISFLKKWRKQSGSAQTKTKRK